MAYIFRCDTCGYEEALDMPCPEEMRRECSECGIGGCEACLTQGVCSMCSTCFDDNELDDR